MGNSVNESLDRMVSNAQRALYLRHPNKVGLSVIAIAVSNATMLYVERWARSVARG